MNRQKIVWQGDPLQLCAHRERGMATTSKNYLESLIRILAALLVSTFLASCISAPPKYEVYPTLLMKERLERPEKESPNRFDWWVDPCSDVDLQNLLSQKTKEFHWWTERLKSELCTMALHEWRPATNLLKETLRVAAEEYAIQNAEEKYGFVSNEPDLPLAQKAFYNKFKLDKNDPNGNAVTSAVIRMLEFIDYEHPNLLVDVSHLKSAPSVDHYKLPSMVSNEYPVAIGVTRWATPSPPESKPSGPNIVIIGNTVVTSSELSRFLASEGEPSETKQAGVKKDDGAKEEDKKLQTEPKKKATNPSEGSEGQTKLKKDQSNEKRGKSAQTKGKPVLIEGFKPEQRVTLSLSTVLNSPSAFDRVEYASTYLYLQAFPFPPNGGIVLEKEFWRRFFALNMTRDPLVQKDATSNDMLRAIEDMRVRITDIETTVKLRDLDLGSLTRKTSDKLTAEVAATAAVPPTLTGITPKLSYSSGVDTEATMKLQQQLDQRSTYVDPYGHFLRIIQRGMQSVNLAGRFVENLTLRIPTAQDQIPALVPVQDSDSEAVKHHGELTRAARYQVKWLSQPIYSRVDALTLSIVAARQATALAKSTKDSFRVDDPKDAVFIVKVTKPYRITLWQHERETCEVMLAEIFGNEKDLPKNQKVFFTTFEKERPAPLRLYGFTPEQQHELLRKIQKLATHNKYAVVSLPIDSDTMITIGLADDPWNPTKLVGFKKES
jgi:hypothetical protein